MYARKVVEKQESLMTGYTFQVRRFPDNAGWVFPHGLPGLRTPTANCDEDTTA